MRAAGFVAVVALASGCGAATGLEVGGDATSGGSGASSASSGAGGHAADLKPAPCKITDTWTVYENGENAYAAAVAQNGDEIGILFWEDDLAGPRELRFARVDAGAPKVTSWVSATMSGAITQAGLVAHEGEFYASWADAQGDVHVGLAGAAAFASDIVVGESPGLGCTTLGKTANGQLAAFWTDTKAATSLLVATSENGQDFGDTYLIATPATASALSIAPASAGAALAWSASVNQAEGSELHAAIVEETGAPTVPDQTLTHHPMRYVYDAAIVRAESSLVIATTDSRVDIGDVPLYSTALALNGASIGSDTRLTFSGGHEKLDMVFDGTSSILGYPESNDPGSQVWVRQLDGEGHQLFDALQVSQASYLESGCCARTSDVKIATDDDGRVTVFWSEGAAPPQGSFQATSLKAARLDCAARP